MKDEAKASEDQAIEKGVPDPDAEDEQLHGGSKAELVDAAQLAAEAQPTGHTFETTSVSTKVGISVTEHILGISNICWPSKLGPAQKSEVLLVVKANNNRARYKTGLMLGSSQPFMPVFPSRTPLARRMCMYRS